MEENKNRNNLQENPGEQAGSGNRGGQGRVQGAQQQEHEHDATDISYMDQQEGNMNNGTLGGNFAQEEEWENR